MIAILTNTIPATDTKPTRIKARFGEPGWGGKTHTAAWDYELKHECNHKSVALSLWAQSGRTGEFEYLGSAPIGNTKRAHFFRLCSN